MEKCFKGSVWKSVLKEQCEVFLKDQCGEVFLKDQCGEVALKDQCGARKS